MNTATAPKHTATSERVTVVHKVVTEVPQEVIKLELSIDEAIAVRDVLYRVGGHPDTTARGLTDHVCAAVHKALGADRKRHFPLQLHLGSSVYFADGLEAR